MKTKQPKSKPMRTFGVRADAEKMREAYELKIDVQELFRSALDQELLKQNGKCPTCGVRSPNRKVVT